MKNVVKIFVINILKKWSEPRPEKTGWDSNDILKRIINTILLGLLSVLVFSYTHHKNGAIKIACAALMVAGAAFLIGSFIGFLFGIPMTLQAKTDNQDDKVNGISSFRQTNNYRPNTNLEQISDWLTKILVGVGLTQIGQIRSGFSELILSIKPELGGNSTFSGAVIIYFLLCGFMFGYLWSRLHMPKALATAELDAIGERIVRQVQQHTDRQAEADAKALAMVNAQLNPAPGVNPIAQADLTNALKEASPVIKVTAFNQAHVFRQQHWRTDKRKTELVIPIFRALIDSDPDERFHRNYAQLGYALKDKKDPDWQGAEEALSKAISIRNKNRESGRWAFYDFNRAYCRIMINKTTGKFDKDSIFKDLDQAAQSEGIKQIILSNEEIIKWLTVNALTI